MNERSEHDIHISQENTLIEILAELKRLNAALASTSRSSVELAENAKGGVQIAVKAYVDSPIDAACIEAASGFATMKREVERGQMNGWAETVAALQNGETA